MPPIQPLFSASSLVDDFIPLRGVYWEELHTIYGLYYNSTVVNIFNKAILWVLFFGIGFPLSLVGRKLFGKDSDNLYSWPDKYFFSGTMLMFFSML